jgi:hypothetical protein
MALTSRTTQSNTAHTVFLLYRVFYLSNLNHLKNLTNKLDIVRLLTVLCIMYYGLGHSVRSLLLGKDDSVNMGDNGTYVASRMGQEFHHTTKDGTKLKIPKLFLEFFHLMFLDQSKS